MASAPAKRWWSPTLIALVCISTWLAAGCSKDVEQLPFDPVDIRRFHVVVDTPDSMWCMALKCREMSTQESAELWNTVWDRYISSTDPQCQWFMWDLMNMMSAGNFYTLDDDMSGSLQGLYTPSTGAYYISYRLFGSPGELLTTAIHETLHGPPHFYPGGIQDQYAEMAAANCAY